MANLPDDMHIAIAISRKFQDQLDKDSEKKNWLKYYTENAKRWYDVFTLQMNEFSTFQTINTSFYIVKDDLVSHLLNKLCSTNYSGYRFIVSLVISKRLKLQKPDCAHLKDFLMLMNLLFFKKFLASLEAKIFFVEAVSKKLTSSFLIFFAFLKMNVFTLTQWALIRYEFKKILDGSDLYK